MIQVRGKNVIFFESIEEQTYSNSDSYLFEGIDNKTIKLEQGSSGSNFNINVKNNGLNTVYLAPVYIGSQATEMMCVWDTGSDVKLYHAHKI